MLLQASVGQIFSGRLTRDHGYLAITMKHYPRFLRRELRDEYIHALSPPFCLFEHYKQVKAEVMDANEAFRLVDYENRFWLEDDGFLNLKRLSTKAKKENVFVVCQCEIGVHCHRELLLLMAQHFYGVKIGPVYNAYSKFRQRLKGHVSTRDVPLEL
jgi:hypothetical protein